jgi:hypothetical protein
MGERRQASRFEVNRQCTLSLDGRELPALIVNLSDQGALLRFERDSGAAVTDGDLGAEASLVLSMVTPHRLYTGEIIRRYFVDKTLHVVLRFWKSYREIPTA